MVKVSVIVPVYNVEKYLTQCLDSLVNQTLKDIEIIIVNDESPDNSQAIIDKYAKRYPKIIKAYKKKNGGLSDARNYGIERATGDYIGFVDSDDFVELDMYEDLYKAAKKHCCEIAVGQYLHYALDEGPISKCGIFPFESYKVYTGRDFLLNSNVMVVWNKIYKKSLIIDHPFPITWFEDVAWSPVVMSRVKRLCYVPKPYYHYIRREGSIASSHENLKTLQGIDSVKYAINNCLQSEVEATAYMAANRLIFESRVRSGYADKYMSAIHDIRNEIKSSSFVYNDPILFSKIKRYLNEYKSIPKTVYYDNFGKREITETEKDCINSWMGTLMYADGNIICLDETNCDVNESPIIAKAYSDGKYETVGHYFKLKELQKNGGIAMSKSMKATGFISPLLHASKAFFGYYNDKNILTGIYASIDNQQIIDNIISLLLENINEYNPMQKALNICLIENTNVTYNYDLEVSFSNGYNMVYDDIRIYATRILTYHCEEKLGVTEYIDAYTNKIIKFGEEDYKPVNAFYYDVLMKFREDYLNFRLKQGRKNKKRKSKIDELKNNMSLWNFVMFGWRLFKYLRKRVSNIEDSLHCFISLMKYRKSSACKNNELYIDCLRNQPVKNNLVLIESFYGRGMLSSPYALFLAWKQREDFNDFEFVWVLDNLKSHKELIAINKKEFSRISFVQRGSTEYLKVLATAKYLINDVTFFFNFIKRPEQIYVNTWHSITVKTLGFDIPETPLNQKNVIKNFLCCDYFLSPNRFMREKIFLKSHLMDGLFSGKIIEEGHPRDDLTFNTSRETVIQKMLSLGIKSDKNKKIIVYAPTWRGTNVNNPTDDIDNYMNFVKRVQEGIDNDKYTVLLRVHQLAYAKMKSITGIKDILIPSTIDANKMFAATDILITDYSSIFFDYMVTKKPVLFYINDLDEYQKYRGVYFNTEELPGPVTSDTDEIINYINNLGKTIEDYSFRYNEIYSWACPYEDGKVSERVLNIVLDNYNGRIYDGYSIKKIKVLIYTGDLLTLRSFMLAKQIVDFCNNISNELFDVTIIVPDKNDNIQNEYILKLIDSGVRPLGRDLKHTVYTAKEKKVLLKSEKKPLLPKYKKILSEALRLEWNRCIGDSEFDLSICLTDEDTEIFYAYLMLFGNSREKIICNTRLEPYTNKNCSKLYDLIKSNFDNAFDGNKELEDYLLKKYNGWIKIKQS